MHERSGRQSGSIEETSSHVVRVGQLDRLQQDVWNQEPPLEGVHPQEPLTSRDAAANRFVVTSIVLHKNNLTTEINFYFKK